MASASAFKFLSQLPAPKNSSVYDSANDSWFKNRGDKDAPTAGSGLGKKQPPPYGKRQGFIPRRVEDFGDGGAFPEIHVAQYPLDMGRKQEKVSNSKVLPVSVDAEGNIAYDAIVKQGANAKKTVFSSHSDLVPKIQDEDLAALQEKPVDDVEEDEEAKDTMERTKAAFDKIVSARLSAAQPKNVPGVSQTPTYIKYTPNNQSAAYNSGAKERVIRMVEMPVDPLEPPKFKHKRVPKGTGSPPVPVMHSPPRPVTVKDQQDWKIPPCISNWKNPKGYTIPLDKRLAADGRGLQEVQINDNFARLSESLYVAENKAREEVEMRSKIQRDLMLREKEKKEQELRLLAQRARMERAGGGGLGGPSGGAVAASGREASDAGGIAGAGGGEARKGETREDREERLKREALREERRRERERERRLEAKEGAPGKKSKITRDRDRDVSEKIALGMANVGGGGGEVVYDQRLFNQEQGMESGFGTEDAYNIYDKALFNRDGASGLYKVRKGADDELYGGAGGAEGGEGGSQMLRTERFKADKGFAGAGGPGGGGSGGVRDGPVEFERDVAEADPFGLDQFLTQVKTGKKAMDKVGAGGGMKAGGGAGKYDDYEGGPSRSRVDFQRGGR